VVHASLVGVTGTGRIMAAQLVEKAFELLVKVSG
jgi:hypothetical protein